MARKLNLNSRRDGQQAAAVLTQGTGTNSGSEPPSNNIEQSTDDSNSKKAIAAAQIRLMRLSADSRGAFAAEFKQVVRQYELGF